MTRSAFRPSSFLAIFAVAIAAILAAWRATAAEERAAAPAPRIPLGLPQELGPLLAAEQEAARLGRQLFHSRVLSRDLTIACVNCHDPGRNFARNEKRTKGIYGRLPERNSPTILNRALGTHHFFDGRATTLEEQVLGPIANELEMDLPIPDAVKRMNNDPEWREAFSRVYGRAPDADALAHALASFVRAQLLGDSPVDAFRAGDTTALSQEERQGLWLFESRAGCWQCHSGPNFSDERFHATGIGASDGTLEPGRFAITGDPADRGRFKTPTLRGALRTAPYMHDGSLATFDDVLDHYVRGGRPHDDAGEVRELAGLDPALAPLELSDADRRHLVAFLEALSRKIPPVATTDPAANQGIAR
jgi:cytochrome c peroxidase